MSAHVEGSGIDAGRRRPTGITPGAASVVAAWFVGVAIARLTGAAAVVLLLVGSFVAIAAASLAGWWRLRGVGVVGAIAPAVAQSGGRIDVAVDVRDPSTSGSAVRVSGALIGGDVGEPVVVPAGDASRVPVSIGTTAAGVFDVVSVDLESTGGAGLVRWRRRSRVATDPISVAPVASGPLLPVVDETTADDGPVDARGRDHHGEIDGVRPWRHGESDHAIHWPSTLRANELIAHDRTTSHEARWLVPYRSDPARLRWTLDEGLRNGIEVRLSETDEATGTLPPDAAIGAGGSARVRTREDAMRWSARRAAEVAADDPEPAVPLWQRSVAPPRTREPDWVVPVSARWSAAIAAAISIAMLLGSLHAAWTAVVLAIAGLAAGAAICVRYRASRRPIWSRIVVAALAVTALIRIASESAGLDGLVTALRGPLPDLLVALVVLHGFEVADRRTARIHVAITGILVAYAAGLRIDDLVGGWMLAWAAAAAVAMTRLGDRRPRAPESRGATIGAIGWVGLGTAAAFALATLVPIPDGPASLGLPAVSNDDAIIEDPGALAGPSGSPDAGGSGGAATTRNGALGEVGGYPGFSSTLDTSIRGDLGDQVVMRVRAPEPAFWRGQTFTEFDGRVWTVSDQRGERLDGPEIVIQPTLGDLPARGVDSEPFIQTYHVEADLPNVIFAAARPDTVIFDGSVFARPDGSIRADRALGSGSVYTVVSDRVPVTADVLRAQGDLGERFGAITRRGAVELLAPYLALPASTTDRTVELAGQLRVPGSTYDTILAMENWLAVNTVYDLDAPVPDDGTDAVDEHLFGSRRGFCEQIASSLVIMLRSQGVPARLATGYIPGERDLVSGVWKVRARDAHAWVEVWFPDTGWEAFDPTAEVPLAGDADRSTVGADAATAILRGVATHPVEVGLLLGAGLFAVAALRSVRAVRRRRRRGRWGVLRDRFARLGGDGEGHRANTAPGVARALEERWGDTAQGAREVAELLDRVAFDPVWSPDDAAYDWARAEVDRLERTVRRAPTGSRELATTSS